MRCAPPAGSCSPLGAKAMSLGRPRPQLFSRALGPRPTPDEPIGVARASRVTGAARPGATRPANQTKAVPLCYSNTERTPGLQRRRCLECSPGAAEPRGTRSRWGRCVHYGSPRSRHAGARGRPRPGSWEPGVGSPECCDDGSSPFRMAGPHLRQLGMETNRTEGQDRHLWGPCIWTAPLLPLGGSEETQPVHPRVSGPPVSLKNPPDWIPQTLFSIYSVPSVKGEDS
ncbi:uncharacterized protein LOC122204608 [Panthera leo]|uniref:uncharacterized protein LOC122204608 n=1 Tax=Panthera leo TaxID=9689 RepID=UPI001C69E6EA|nr:uncharacterized protein LOC122204608 [Panthera leo]